VNEVAAGDLKCEWGTALWSPEEAARLVVSLLSRPRRTHTPASQHPRRSSTLDSMAKLLGIGNPILDISADVGSELLTKYAAAEAASVHQRTGASRSRTYTRALA